MIKFWDREKSFKERNDSSIFKILTKMKVFCDSVKKKNYQQDDTA